MHRLTGHGRRLYAILADKKRLGRPNWTFTLDELKALLGVGDRKTYKIWGAFRRYVLLPALASINDFGTVSVKMTPQKLGRSVHAVRFDWQWKDPRDATETVAQNERHSAARRKDQSSTDAPPMIEDQDQAEPALTWWGRLTSSERDEWAELVGRTFKAGGKTYPRRDADIARKAFARTESGQAGFPAPETELPRNS